MNDTINNIIKRINAIDKELVELSEQGYTEEANKLLEERMELQAFVNLGYMVLLARS